MGDFGVISVEHRVQGEIVDTIEHGIFNNRPTSLLLIYPCFCSTSKNLFTNDLVVSDTGLHIPFHDPCNSLRLALPCLALSCLAV